MTEAEIQNKLFIELERKGHRLIVPNVTILGWESDLVSVTKADFIYEYEIKCSRADFRRDAHKFRHGLMRGDLPNWKARGPSYFYYVVPRDLIQPADVPDHAGLIYSHPRMQIVKKAPRLHALKITENQRRWLEKGLTMRYWKKRVFAVPEDVSETARI